MSAVENYKNDFGASDNALTTAARASYPDLLQFPTVAAAVVLAYNLPGINGTTGATLVLEREVIARIYLGEVRIHTVLVDERLRIEFRTPGGLAMMPCEKKKKSGDLPRSQGGGF